jgi:hypothetical protein
MLKKLTLIASLLVLMLFAGSNLVAQSLQILNEDGKKENTFELISSTKSNTNLTFQLNSYWMSEVQTPNGAEKIVNAMESARMLKAGAPDLPLFSASLIIPDHGKMEVKIVNSTYTEVENVSIAPSKGNLTRDINPADVAFEYGKVYQENTFFPGNLAQINKPYIVRDFRGSALWVYPFQYNPVTKTLRIYTSIELEVVATDAKGINEFNRTKALTKIDREFHHIYNRRFINYDGSKYDPVPENGTMLIICHDDWTAEMQPLVDWKNLIGRPTEMVTVTEAGGTAAAIGTFVENYYNDNGLTHLLLVGDASQVPTNSGAGLGGDSDPAYAYITGDDHYVEFFVGRFSAESASDVTTQVERTIAYEDGSTLTSGWLSKTTGIASDDGSGGDDGEMDYDHYRNMATDLLGFTYTESGEFFEGSQGGNDATGNPTASQVADNLNAGVGIINYTGHGSDNSWVTSGFNNTDINGLTNDNMLPFIWSVACVNGNFVGQTCFGEAWMRATNGANPTGAIAIFASTINQSWNPPMAGQDEMVDILVESYANNIKRTYGAISFNGCHLMNDEYSDFAMTDTWTIFGDPSLLVRTEDPTAMVVSYPGALLIGQESFTVTCDTEDALVSLTINGEILATAPVTGGTAALSFTAPTTPGEMKVTITGFNKITHQGTVEITPADEPYIVVSGHTINDFNTGNANYQADYGESVMLDVTLENVAEEGSGFDASGVEMTISTTDEYVTITTNAHTFGDIAAGTSLATTNAFAFDIAEMIPDQHVVMFDVVITGADKTYTWNSTMTVTLNAPVLEMSSMEIMNDDDANGRLDPGETADIKCVVANVGHANAEEVLNTLTLSSPFITVMTNNVTIGVDAENTNYVMYNVTASDATPNGTTVDLNIVSAQGDYTCDATHTITVGQPPEISIGDGTESSSYYPFYTYYENNKSQMLYLGSELGAGEINIQEMAFDFTTIGSETEVQNLSIKFIETAITEVGSSYEDDATGTEVYSSTTYTMPTTTGWHIFDIADYVFDATNNNLLIQITWGDNGAWSSPAYEVACTSTAFNSVTYGYSDSETPPVYDGNSASRPNIMLYIEGEGTGIIYTATFNVTAEGTPIPNASVMVGTLETIADESGVSIYNLIEGNYYYSVYVDGYDPIENVPFVVDENEIIDVDMVVGIENSLSQNVHIYPNPANNQLYIEMNNISNAVVSMIDLSGKTIINQMLSNNSNTIDLSGISAGVYLVNIRTNNDNLIQKLIIE